MREIVKFYKLLAPIEELKISRIYDYELVKFHYMFKINIKIRFD